MRHVVMPNGEQRLYAQTAEEFDKLTAMCNDKGTVTWCLCQDTTKSLEPGRGMYFRSEKVRTFPVPTQPRALEEL